MFHETFQNHHCAWKLAWLTLAASLGGCATTAGSSSYEVQHAEFERESSRPAAHREDDVAAGSTLDRASFIRAVLRKNPSIDSARQGWRAALARVQQVDAFEDPMLELGIAPLSIGSASAPLGYEVGISQKLPWFGKRSLETSVASAEAEAAKSDFEATKRELALTALVLYNQYFVATRSLEINAHHVELMHTMRDSAIAQFSSGRGSAQDSLQAEAELTHMEHDALVLRSQRDVTVAQMNELLHRAPELPLPLPPSELELLPEPDKDAKGLVSEAISGRPDIRAARQRAQAEQSRSDQADRDAYPDFTLSTSYSSMWEMPEHRWVVGLGFNLPLQTGRRTGAADEARAMRAQFESEAMRMTDSARTQVFVAVKQLEESKHVLGLFETRLLPIARDRIDAARAGFVTSQNSFVAVMEAERDLRGVELDYQMARAEHDRRRAELDRALGRMPGLTGEEGNR